MEKKTKEKNYDDAVTHGARCFRMRHKREKKDTSCYLSRSRMLLAMLLLRTGGPPELLAKAGMPPVWCRLAVESTRSSYICMLGVHEDMHREGAPHPLCRLAQALRFGPVPFARCARGSSGGVDVAGVEKNQPPMATADGTIHISGPRSSFHAVSNGIYSCACRVLYKERQNPQQTSSKSKYKKTQT
jgi:hypothetical protein